MVCTEQPEKKEQLKEWTSW